MILQSILSTGPGPRYCPEQCNPIPGPAQEQFFRKQGDLQGRIIVKRYSELPACGSMGIMQDTSRSSPPPGSSGKSPLDLVIDQAIAEKAFPGIACGVWIDGHHQFSRCTGYTADPLKANTVESEPITEKTLFDSASLTKPLATTLLIMRAAEAGFLDIDKTVGFYLPQAGGRVAEIPVHTLLTHTSGMPAIPAIERHFPLSNSLERDDAIAALLAIRPERKPGEHVVYSCTGYMLLGLILEQISGDLIGNLYRREVAGPLCLPGATFAPGISLSGEPLVIAGAAATEFCAWRKRRIHGQVHDESAYCLGGHAGNAGLFLSLEDAFITGLLLLQEGSVNGKQFLAAASVADIAAEKTGGLGERRSFGFRLHDAGTFEGPLWGSSSFGHTGFTGTSMFIAPDHRLLSIILTNRVYYGREETTQKIADFRTAFHRLVFKNFCR